VSGEEDRAVRTNHVVREVRLRSLTRSGQA